MDYTKIITHTGTHHADEVLAIATVFKFYGILPIERKYDISKEELANSEILILDIGRDLNPEFGNFDHHQNGEIEATNLLTLEYFCKDVELKNLLKCYLYKHVDALDRGLVHFEPNQEFFVPSFSSIISSFNYLSNGFDTALDFAIKTLKGIVEMSLESIKSKEVWKSLEKQGQIVIQHNNHRIVGWAGLAEQDNILLYIFPCDRKEGNYRLMVRDTRILTIPPNGNQSFLHANGFTAAYTSFEFALEHAEEIIEIYFNNVKHITT